MTQGRRIDSPFDATGVLVGEWPKPGDYWKHGNVWSVRTPAGLVGNLANHTVIEHEDGTITVSPSILTSAPHRTSGPTSYHGFLERGVWRDA